LDAQSTIKPPMSNSLLGRQASLLEYLTSGDAIFGEGDLSLDAFGFSRGLLHLEAKYSQQKRMEKIEAVLATTLDLLGTSREGIVRAFVQAYPPASIGRLDNARQFHAFLLARWQERAPEQPCLPDIAAFEIAHAAVQAKQDAPAQAVSVARPGHIRRHSAVALLRCVYDIMPILEGRGDGITSQPRETLIAIATPERATAPSVYALPCELFSLVELFDEWTDPQVFADIPDADSIIGQLAVAGLVEVTR
jgi:hypothetical protein